MVVTRTYDPMMGQKTAYIYYAHKRPWRMNVGTIGAADITHDGVIRVQFELTREQAEKADRFDPEGDRVMLEVLDAENRTVIENWLPLRGLNRISSKLCLGDPNAAQ